MKTQHRRRLYVIPKPKRPSDVTSGWSNTIWRNNSPQCGRRQERGHESRGREGRKGRCVLCKRECPILNSRLFLARPSTQFFALSMCNIKNEGAGHRFCAYAWVDCANFQDVVCNSDTYLQHLICKFQSSVWDHLLKFEGHRLLMIRLGTPLSQNSR